MDKSREGSGQTVGYQGWRKANNTERPKHSGKGLSRRDFLWKAPVALVVGASAVEEAVVGVGRDALGNIAAGALSGLSGAVSAKNEFVAQASAATEVAFSQDFLTKLKKEDADKLMSMEKVILEEVKLLMPDSDNAHIASGMEQVAYQVLANFNRDGDLGRSSQKQWIKLVREVAPTLDIELNSIFVHFLPGLIFVESSGNPSDKGKADDVGLCQLTPKAIKDMYQRLVDGKNKYSKKEDEWSKAKTERLNKAIAGIKINNGEIDVKDPKTNLTLTLEYLDYLNTIFPEKSLALWAFNPGSMPMVEAICASRGLPQSKADDINEGLNDFSKYAASLETIKKLIKGSSSSDALDFTNLREPKASVRAYPARIVGARALMRAKNLL